MLHKLNILIAQHPSAAGFFSGFACAHPDHAGGTENAMITLAFFAGASFGACIGLFVFACMKHQQGGTGCMLTMTTN